MTTTTSSTPRRPRKRPAPSQRDQKIFIEYQVGGRRQCDLAEDNKLTQSRVSQIIRRVAAWRASADPRDEGELTLRQQQRLDRWMEHERLQFVCREAIRHFQEQQQTTTHKKGTRGDKSFDETTERLSPPNLQCLKVLLNANAQLSKLEEKPWLPGEEPDDRQRSGIMYEKLRELREKAERDGDVVSNGSAWGVILRLVDALLGKPNKGRFADPALRELCQAILPYCDRAALAAAFAASDKLEQCDADVDVGWDKAALAAAGPPSPSLETSQEKKNPNSSTCAEPSPSPQTPAADDLTAKAAAEKKDLERKWRNPPPPPDPSKLRPGEKPKSPFDDPQERHRQHLLRLRQLREMWRTGLPGNFTFYPEDGPMPPPPPYRLDGAPG